MTPLVSVVMPVYNQEEHVAAAIDSILCQSFTDFEFVIVDDGSTDGTRAILRGFSDPRIKLVDSDHVGFLDALTTGVRQSRGKWIARMDSDDITHPERFRIQLAFLERNPECLFVGSTYGLITPNQKYLAPRKIFQWRYLQPKDLTVASCLFADPSVLFDRESAFAAGLYDTEFENEKPLWYKLLSLGKGAVFGQPLHYLRWRLGSHSRSKIEERAQANEEIRRRYDFENLSLTTRDIRLTQNGNGRLRLPKLGVNYYLLAGDYQAARDVALQTWKTEPVSGEGLKLAAQAMLGCRSLRLWRRPNEDPNFVPVKQPWTDALRVI